MGEEKVSRRGVLGALVVAGAALLGAVALVPGLGALLDPLLRRRAGSGGFIVVGEASVLRDDRPVSLPVIGEWRDAWSRDRIPCEANGWQGKNWTGFRSDALTELLRRIDATLVPDERADLYERAHRIWAEELPALPLYRPEQALLLAPGVRGVVAHAGGDYALPWNAEDWHFV